MERPKPFNPLTQAFQDLYDNSASFTMDVLDFAMAYPWGSFSRLKTEKEKNEFMEDFLSRFEKFGDRTIRSMNAFKEEFNKGQPTKEEVQFINSRFEIVYMEFLDFLASFESKKEDYALRKEILDKLQIYHDKMEPFFFELWGMIDAHNEKNPENKIMSFPEAEAAYDKFREELLADDLDEDSEFGEVVEPFNLLTQSFQDLYCSSCRLKLNIINFDIDFERKISSGFKTEEEKDAFIEMSLSSFSEFGDKTIRNMNVFKEEFNKSQPTKEEIQFINGFFNMVYTEFFDFITEFEVMEKKEDYAAVKEVLDKLGVYRGKMRQFFVELGDKIVAHNEKNPEIKIRSVSEAKAAYDKSRGKFLASVSD